MANGKKQNKTNSLNLEKQEILRLSARASQLADKGLSYFYFIEHNGEINCISNMSDFHLKVLREFIDEKAWDVKKDRRGLD